MKKIALLATFLTLCLTSAHAHRSDLNLIEEIKSEKPFVCEVILIELNEASKAPFLLVDKIPSEWKKKKSELKLSLGYIDQNEIKFPGVGAFALKNRFHPSDSTMSFQYAIARTGEHEDRADLAGDAITFLGKWFVIVNQPNFKNENPTSDRGAIAIRFWGQ